MNANPKKQIWIHATCATDTNQVQWERDLLNKYSWFK
jgi:hypothetical protein